MKHFYEGIAALAAILAIVGFITGRSKLSELIFGVKASDVWYVASLANQTDYPMTFSVFRPEKKIWGIVPIEPHSVKTFSVKNHTVDVMLNGEMLLYRDPRERLTHTYDGVECYVLEGPTYAHEPTEDDLRAAPPNQFLEMVGGNPLPLSNGKVIYVSLLNPRSGELKTFIPEGFPDKRLSIFEDPETIILTQPSPTSSLPR